MSADGTRVAKTITVSEFRDGVIHVTGLDHATGDGVRVREGGEMEALDAVAEALGKGERFVSGLLEEVTSLRPPPGQAAVHLDYHERFVLQHPNTPAPGAPMGTKERARAKLANAEEPT